MDHKAKTAPKQGPTPPKVQHAPAQHTRPQFGKFGPQFDYRHAHCLMAYQGRDLLGEIMDVQRDDVRGICVATVRHMNGEEWPIRPALSALSILVRS